MFPLYEKRPDLLAMSSPRGLVFPLHLHAHVEMVYALEGSVRMQIDGREHLLREGGFAFIAPNRIHSYEPPPAGAPANGRVLLALFSPGCGGDFRDLLLRSCPAQPVLEAGDLHPDVPFAMRRLAALDAPGDIPCREQLAKALIQLVLARTAPFVQMQRCLDTQPPELTARLLAYLAEHFPEPVSLDTLAVHLGVSKYSVSRVFSEKLHMGFCAYLNALRVDYAQGLLRQSGMDILTICGMSGYENPRTFNREFRRRCGCTPSEYRAAPREAASGAFIAAAPSPEPSRGESLSAGDSPGQ